MMVADLTYYKKTTPGRVYSADEEEFIQILLDAAEDAIRAYTGNKWSTAAGSDATADLRQCIIVRRYFENPDGITSETVDGVTYSRSLPADGIELTSADEKALVRAGIRTTNSSAIFTVSRNRNGGFVW